MTHNRLKYITYTYSFGKIFKFTFMNDKESENWERKKVSVKGGIV